MRHASRLVILCFLGASHGGTIAAHAQSNSLESQLELLINEHSDKNTIRTTVIHTSTARLVYLCNGLRGRWIASFATLTSNPITRATIIFKGFPEGDVAAYHNFELVTASRGNGFFTAFDLGPLADDEPIDSTTRFTPLSFAIISLVATNDRGWSFQTGAHNLPEVTIQELARCSGPSFPRVLHNQ